MSTVITPERVRKILSGFRHDEDMGNHAGENRAPGSITLDRDAQAAIYIARDADFRMQTLSQFGEYGPQASALLDFEAGVADRLAEIADALTDGRLIVAPKGQTIAEQQDEGAS